MPKRSAAGPVIGDVNVFEVAKRRSRFGRRDWLVFKRRDGQFEAHPYGPEGIKAALLAGGSRTRFTWFDSKGIGNICRSWSYGVHLWRCARGWQRFAAA